MRTLHSHPNGAGRDMPRSDEADRGMSLAGLLVTVVILGALTATAVVSLRSLTGTGGNGSPTSDAAAAANLANRVSGHNVANSGLVQPRVGCRATADAARSASAIYFAHTGGRYPTRWSDLTVPRGRVFPLPTDVVINAANPRQLAGPDWTLTMTGGGATAPAFACA